MSDDDQVYGFPKPSKKGKAKPSRIRPVTDERAAQKSLYLRFVRPAFLAGLARGQGRGKKAPLCERCGKEVAGHVHHISGREEWKLVEFGNLRGLGDKCHKWVHANPEKATAEGWLERRNDARNDDSAPT